MKGQGKLAMGVVHEVGLRPLSQAIADRLAEAADEKARQWWERYLKGAVPFRGVPSSEPGRVQQFVDEHRGRMSREALKAAVARLPGPVDAKPRPGRKPPRT